MASIKKFLKEQAYNVYYGYGNPDHPTCPKCGNVMEFHGGDRPSGEGYWDCPGCNFNFTEEDLEDYEV